LLGKVPSEEAIKLLITALDDEDMWVRIEAIKSLSVRPNINVFDILKQRYNYMPTPIKIEILKYMGKLDIEASREFLSSQLSNEDEEIRSTAVQNLSPSDKKSIEILINTAKLDKNWLIRKEALKSLANANIKNFENLVFDIAKSETDLYVKKTILDILKTIKVKEVPEYIFNWVYDNQLLENFIELMAQRNDIVSYLDRLPYRIRSKIEKTLDLLSK
jgi:HEAT repeat protein